MKRMLAFLLSLTIALGSVPAQAQTVRVSLQTGTAPAPVPTSFVAPASGALAPALSAPSLAAAVPALTPVPVPSAIPAPVAAVPAASPVAAATPLASLKSIAAPQALAVSGVAFDGSLSRSAASVAEPPQAPEAAPRKSFLQRYRESRNKTPLQNAFGKSMFLTSMAAAAVPVVWGAVPALKYAYALSAADLIMLAILLPLSVGTAVWRKVRPQTAAKPPPSRRLKIAVVALGVMLGIGAAVAPYQGVGLATQTYNAVTDRHKEADKKENVIWIRGGAVEDEAAKLLELNPVGREVLAKLRDRGGVLRMPSFYLSTQDDSYGEHENFFDGVYLSVGELTSRGWTVEQFLKDPALQRQFIREMGPTVVHELVHAVQGRRPPWTKGYFKSTIEAEQEAFFKEMLYRVAELERDPKARNDNHDSWMAPAAADDLDDFLKRVADMYEDNVVVGEPYFNAFLKEQRARWPEFRVHIYRVLAAREDNARMAKMYMDKAKAAAKEAGLPEPSPLVASR